MDIRLGDQVLRDVEIPLLWGSRVISQDREGRLSVVDLSQGVKIEIIGDRPVPGMPIVANEHGFDVLVDGEPLYHYDPEQKMLVSIGLDLPSCQVGTHFVRVGANTFEGNTVSGFGIGIVVTSTATWMGAPMPQELQLLVA
jgi:hypothetical protein